MCVCVGVCVCALGEGAVVCGHKRFINDRLHLVKLKCRVFLTLGKVLLIFHYFIHLSIQLPTWFTFTPACMRAHTLYRDREIFGILQKERGISSDFRELRTMF